MQPTRNDREDALSSRSAGALPLAMRSFATATAGFCRAFPVAGEIAAGGLAALPPRLRRKFMILREAALFVWDALASLAPRLGSQLVIFREAALLIRHAFPAFARNFPLLV